MFVFNVHGHKLKFHQQLKQKVSTKKKKKNYQLIKKKKKIQAICVRKYNHERIYKSINYLRNQDAKQSLQYYKKFPQFNFNASSVKA